MESDRIENEGRKGVALISVCTVLDVQGNSSCTNNLNNKYCLCKCFLRKLSLLARQVILYYPVNMTSGIIIRE
jgi:hypothetical protein